jgi:hypothetical protein
VHGHSAVDFAAVKQLVHLGMTFFVVSNLDGGDGGIF